MTLASKTGLMCLLVAALVAQSQAANVDNIMLPYDVDNHTVALYHLDGSATDEVGNHNGTLHGDAGYDAGRFAQGLSLDGGGDYVRIGNVHQNPVRDMTQGTVETWFLLDSAPSFFVLLGSGMEYGDTWDDGFFLGRHGGYGSKLMFGMWAWSNGWNFAHSGIDPATLVGQWHHAAGTFGPEGVELWLDGQRIAHLGHTEGMPGPNYPTALIGTDSWAWDTPGYIDEVRISDIQRDPVVPEPASAIVMLLALPAILRCRLRARR